MLWQRAKYFLKQTCFRQKVFSRGIRVKRLELATRKRIVEAIETLASDPSNQNLDVKPLQGRPGEFRLRVGDYRIIYEPEQQILLISVITIRSRGDVYRR